MSPLLLPHHHWNGKDEVRLSRDSLGRRSPIAFLSFFVIIVSPHPPVVPSRLFRMTPKPEENEAIFAPRHLTCTFQSGHAIGAFPLHLAFRHTLLP